MPLPATGLPLGSALAGLALVHPWELVTRPWARPGPGASRTTAPEQTHEHALPTTGNPLAGTLISVPGATSPFDYAVVGPRIRRT